MGIPLYQEIKDSLRRLYLENDRPWLVGFSDGKDSSMAASLLVEVVAGIPADQRKGGMQRTPQRPRLVARPAQPLER